MKKVAIIIDNAIPEGFNKYDYNKVMFVKSCKDFRQLAKGLAEDMYDRYGIYPDVKVFGEPKYKSVVEQELLNQNIY